MMYLKKVEGPRAVHLADGTVMSRADLPTPDTRRWVASRKLAVVRGIAYGLIDRSEALRIYGLSNEELDGWAVALKKNGIKGLKVTFGKGSRQP